MADKQSRDTEALIVKNKVNWSSVTKKILAAVTGIVIIVGGYVGTSTIKYITSIKAEQIILNEQIEDLAEKLVVHEKENVTKHRSMGKYQKLLATNINHIRTEVVVLTSKVHFLERAVGLEEYVKWLKANKYFERTQETAPTQSWIPSWFKPKPAKVDKDKQHQDSLQMQIEKP